jgi:hypothetical protein
VYPTIFKFHLTRDYQLNEMGKRQLRLLSLDGGDVRGLESLFLLKLILEQVGSLK